MKHANRFMFYMVVISAAILVSALVGCKTSSVGVTTGVTMNLADMKEKGMLVTASGKPNVIPLTRVVGIDEHSITLKVVNTSTWQVIGNVKIDCTGFSEKVKVDSVAVRPTGEFIWDSKKEEMREFDPAYLMVVFEKNKIDMEVSVTAEGKLENVVGIVIEEVAK